MKRLLFALAATSVATSHAQTTTPVAAQANVSPSRRMVWAHWMFVMPLELKHIAPYFSPDIGYEAYGANYPLAQELGLEARTGKGWFHTDLQQAKAAGVNGFACDIFAGDAAGYAEQADELDNGVIIAPCLDLSNIPANEIEEKAFQSVLANCQKMAPFKSTARVQTPEGTAHLFFTYGTGMMSPEQWTRVRERVHAQGHRTYFMAALESGGDLETSATFPREVATNYARAFESGYLFANAGRHWNDVLALYKAEKKPFGGGMMPGYYRFNGGYKDAQGTKLYRDEWHRHLKSRPNWTHISTWNDPAENTGLIPLADWNTTRSELTRWFAAKFRGEASPFKSPHLYVTTPKTVYRGGDYVVEGMALNASKSPVRVTTQLIDNKGRGFGQPQSSVVMPNGDGAATVRLRLTTFPPGRFLRARATLSRDGKTLSSVLSAPILVMDELERPPLPTMYYSVPAHHALPGRVTLQLQGKPSAEANAQASVSPPANTKVRFAEVLQNTELGRNFFANKPFRTSVPRREANNSIRSGAPWGFYVGRVTDEKFRVGYSDPIYVPPQGDVRVWKAFAFDEGSGTTARDASPWRKVPELVNIEWITPGANGQGSAVRLDGKEARVKLSQYKTPLGPFSLSMTVRPAKLEGFLYGDGGGLWAEITPRGTVDFVVNTRDKGFVRAQGATPLKVGEWARLRFTNDGKTSRIFINDKLDAQIASGSLRDSGNPMIGGNPYGGGSFAGDVDDFELRAGR